MKNGQCPKCSAANIRVKKGNMGPYGINSIPTGEHGLFTIPATIPLDTYICLSCGYVESYISDRRHLSNIAALWPGVN